MKERKKRREAELFSFCVGFWKTAARRERRIRAVITMVA